MMKNNKNVKFLILISVFAAVTYLISGVHRLPVEKLGISSGIGFDIERIIDGQITYSVPLLINITNENSKLAKVFTGKGMTLADTREDRDTKTDKRILSGYEKVYIISEGFARQGIQDQLDILFNNPIVNDTGFVCVCNGKAEDLLNKKIEGFNSPADFIDGLLRTSKFSNFFSTNYKVIDMYVRADSEGRCLVLPYVDILNDEIRITGLAVFKNDKMVHKLDMEDARLLNLMKENKTNGIISIVNGANDYINLETKADKRVKCTRKGNEFQFTIDVNLKCNVISNQLKEYNKELDKPKTEKEIEEMVSKDTEKKLNKFIEKMKSEYKMDCLELGRAAAAKYGREVNKDKWHAIVSSSQIKVNVKTQIDDTGRGVY